MNRGDVRIPEGHNGQNSLVELGPGSGFVVDPMPNLLQRHGTVEDYLGTSESRDRGDDTEDVDGQKIDDARYVYLITQHQNTTNWVPCPDGSTSRFATSKNCKESESQLGYWNLLDTARMASPEKLAALMTSPPVSLVTLPESEASGTL